MKPKLLKWANIVLSIKHKKKQKVILGYMEIKFNTVVEIMLKVQVFYSDGHLHLFIWINKTAKTKEFLSKIIKKLKKDVTKYLKIILMHKRLLLKIIMLMN